MQLSRSNAMHHCTATAAPQTATRAIVDVRSVAPGDRHPLVFSTFRSLAQGQAFDLVNDHDPQPLRVQFQAHAPGQFAWDELETGPAVWRVRVTRLRGAHADGGCCGGCGGR
jgi:uncharacterized protein (DUF2249 family)